MQKQIVGHETKRATPDAGWLDLEQLVKLQLTSEDSAHPIEAAFRGETERGWIAAEPGPQSIRLSFYSPQVIRRVYLCIDAPEPRTQEFALRWSNDGGLTYRDLVRQQFNFSLGAPREEETYHTDLQGVTDLKLEIVPDIAGGPATATLRVFRVA